MKTICHPIDFPYAYPLSRLGSPESLLFFDIETTGFSGETDCVYLIGCIFYEAEAACWMMSQWFADTPESEAGLLTEFNARLKGCGKLIHFNGDAFDLPFLQKRCLRLGIPFDGFQGESVDIYRRIRPFKTMLGLESLKQKSMEEFFGICREDRYSGGQLIQIYKDYLKAPDPGSFHLLTLHNEEDLKGMCQILPVLNYPDTFRQELRLVSQELKPANQGLKPASQGPILILTYESACTMPLPFKTAGNLPGSQIYGEGFRILCRIPLIEGEMKHFYPNYKDYYYLPYEDTAVHKSVGVYVAKSARQRATAKTCYTKMSGLFLPQIPPLGQPVFQKEYSDKLTCLPYRQELLLDPWMADAYLRQLLGLPAL